MAILGISITSTPARGKDEGETETTENGHARAQPHRTQEIFVRNVHVMRSTDLMNKGVTPMNLLKFTCVVLVVLLNGCYSETTYESEVIIRPGTKGFNYEVQIKGHGEGRGNLHNPFDWTVHNWDFSYWLYLNKIEGTTSANDLAITSNRRCVDSPPWSDYENVEGNVEFQTGKIIVKLNMASYDNNDVVIGHKPFDANGTYMTRVADEQWKPTEQEARQLEVDPCKR